jgi:hypothetical protein
MIYNRIFNKTDTSKLKTNEMKKITIAIACILSLMYCQAQTNEKTDSRYVDTLQINVKDKRFFEAERNTDNTLRFKEVREITDSSKTLTIELTYSNGAGAMLKILNPFSEQLVYKAELYSYKKKDYLETSTIPVYPKLSSFETWPYKIDQIRLTGFKLVKEKE